MNNSGIELIAFGYLEQNLLDALTRSIHREFRHEVTFREVHIELTDFYDPARRQYNGNKLLKVIDTLASPESLKTIGLLNVDLYIPILTFIFGQAYLNGRSAIASRFRLRNEHYGLPADNNLMIHRLVKEVIHELGHTFGMIHCHTPDCVMRSSTYVEEIDQKSENLCPSCKNNYQQTHPTLTP